MMLWIKAITESISAAVYTDAVFQAMIWYPRFGSEFP